MVNVVFVDSFSGEELLQMVSQDVAGVLAAAQGESVTFPVGHFKYEFPGVLINHNYTGFQLPTSAASRVSL